VPSPFDGSRQLALVPHAIAGDTPRDNPTPLSEKISQQPDIFEIDRSLVDTESTRPATLKKPPATCAFPVSGLFTLHTRLPLYLNMLFRFISGIIMRRRLNSAATTVLALRHKRHRLSHHLMLAALLAILCFPPALLQPPIDDNPTPLAQILSAMFCLLAEHDNIHKTDFFFQFITLLVSSADRET